MREILQTHENATPVKLQTDIPLSSIVRKGRKMKVSKITTHVPNLDDVQSVLQKGLEDNFSSVRVSVVQCPDLTQSPFHLSSEGLCGNARLADIGGPPFLLPLVKKEKVFNFKKVSELCELPNAFMIGAGAGPAHVIGVNSELMNNIKYNEDGTVINNAYIAKVDTKDGGCVLMKANSEDFCLMGNFLLSDGRPGKVLEVKASKRHGSENFVTSIKKSLKAYYVDKSVALGGVFLVEKGSAHLHIMQDFSTTPLNSQAEVDNWLRFYDMDTPLICVGELVSHDPGYDLRDEHFHCFSMHGQGGHYHWDTTPDDVEYRGYFVIAETIYRVDQPEQTLQLK